LSEGVHQQRAADVGDPPRDPLADGVAGLGPCLHARLGDPQGAVLGLVDEHGTLTPVLFDPTLGPRAGSVGGSPRSPSIGIAGALGRGKSVFSKRVLWTTLAAGGAVVVVDDVIFTGRTARAAMNELMDWGRASRIYYCALVDRAGRELPIQPDIVGRAVTVLPHQRVDVLVPDIDGVLGVDVVTTSPEAA